MKVLRHAPLVFWLVAVVAIGAVVGAALIQGRTHTIPAATSIQLSAHDRAAIRALHLDLGPMEVGLGTNSSLTAWAQNVQHTAAAAEASRKAWAGNNDHLAADFGQVALNAQQVEGLSSTVSTTTRWTTVTGVGTAIDRVTIDSGALPRVTGGE